MRILSHSCISCNLKYSFSVSIQDPRPPDTADHSALTFPFLTSRQNHNFRLTPVGSGLFDAWYVTAARDHLKSHLLPATSSLATVSASLSVPSILLTSYRSFRESRGLLLSHKVYSPRVVLEVTSLSAKRSSNASGDRWTQTMDRVARNQDFSGWRKVGLSGIVLPEGVMSSPTRTVLDGHGLPRESAGWFKLTEERLIAMGYASHRKRCTWAIYTYWEEMPRRHQTLDNSEAY